MDIHGLPWSSIESLEPHGISWNTMKFIVFAYLSLIDRFLFVAIRGYSWLFRGYSWTVAIFRGYFHGSWLSRGYLVAIRGYFVAILTRMVGVSIFARGTRENSHGMQPAH